MSAASTALTLLVETAGYLRLHEMNHPHAGQLNPILGPDKPVGYKTEVGFIASNSPGKEILALAPALHLQISLAGPLVVVVDVDVTFHRAIEVLHDT